MNNNVQIFGIVEWCGDVVACELGVKTLVVSSCGERGCICDQCQHNGFRCNGGYCSQSDAPTSCEDFNLIFCLGGCLRMSAELTLKLIGKCKYGFNRVTVTKSVPVNMEGKFIVPIKSEDLLPGKWTAVLEIKFSNGQTRKEIREFRVMDCPTGNCEIVDSFEPCAKPQQPCNSSGC